MPEEKNLNQQSGQPTIWREIEKVEKRLEGSLEILDSRVATLEMAHQLQSFQNTLTKERLEELATGQQGIIEQLKNDRLIDQQSIKVERERDVAASAASTQQILNRLDEVQFKNKAEIYDRVKWAILGIIVTAITGGVIAAILNAPVGK